MTPFNLQQWIEDWTWSRPTALLITSILFGGVHLWFRHFPNWQWVIIAGTLGWFCGRVRCISSFGAVGL